MKQQNSRKKAQKAQKIMLSSAWGVEQRTGIRPRVYGRTQPFACS